MSRADTIKKDRKDVERLRTAARKLGLRGPILTVERVGSEQWAVNVDGQMMMVVER